MNIYIAPIHQRYLDAKQWQQLTPIQKRVYVVLEGVDGIGFSAAYPPAPDPPGVSV